MSELLKSQIRWNVLINNKPGFPEDILEITSAREVFEGLIVYDERPDEIKSLLRKLKGDDDQRIENVIFTLNENREWQVKMARFLRNTKSFSHLRLIAFSNDPLPFQERECFHNHFLYSGDLSDLTFLLEEVQGAMIDTKSYYSAPLNKKVRFKSDVHMVSFNRSEIVINTGLSFKEGEVIEPEVDLPRDFFRNRQCLVTKKNDFIFGDSLYQYKVKPLMVYRDLSKEDPVEEIQPDDERHPNLFKAKKFYDAWLTSNEYCEPINCMVAVKSPHIGRALSREKKGVFFKTEIIPQQDELRKFNFSTVSDFLPSLICIVDEGMTHDEIFDLVVDIDRECEKNEGYSPNVLLFSDNISRGSFVGATNRIMSVLVSDKTPTPAGLAKIIDTMRDNLKGNKIANVKRYLESRNVRVTAKNISRVAPHSFCTTNRDNFSIGSIQGECVLKSINEMTCILTFKKDTPNTCTVDFFGLELKLKRGLLNGRESQPSRDGNESLYFINELTCKQKERLRVLINHSSSTEGLEEAVAA